MKHRASMAFGAAVIGLSVGLSAVVTLALTPSDASSGGISTSGVAAADARALALLQQRVADLEARDRTMHATGSPASNREESRELLASSDAAIAALEERVARLEATPPSPPTLASAAPAHDAQLAQVAKREVQFATRVQALRVLHSNQATSDQVLRAHQACRRIPGAYDARAADRVIQMGLNHSDANVRAQVWTSFDGQLGQGLPQLLNPLLRAVRDDASPRARAEAAETLGNFMKHPEARAALRQAANHDPDGHVRQKAQRTLNGSGFGR